MSNLWRRASFTLKFAVVLCIAGCMIAVVPLLLANSEGRNEALDRAADKAAIASNLVQGQRDALNIFVRSVAVQVSGNILADDQLLQTTLAADTGANSNGDVLGVVVAPADVVALQGKAVLPGDGALVRALVTALRAGRTTASGPDGTPWILAGVGVPGSSGTVFVARPLSSSLVSAIDHNLATATDPSEVAVLRGGAIAVAGTLGGQGLAAGGSVGPTVRDALHNTGGPQVVELQGRSLAMATSDLGAGYQMVVTTPLAAIAIAWPSLLLLIGLILLAMIVIVLVVQADLQRPLRRLDRAVAAVGRGEFNVPVPLGSVDEIGRLGSTFEAMRVQLSAMIRATNARAAVATELNSSQPVMLALSRVCGELRRTTEVDAVLILGNRPDTGEPMAVADGIPIELKVQNFLGSDGPLGEGMRHTGSSALLVSAAPASLEAQLGMREYCVAPLRVGSDTRGVLALANMERGFVATDPDLLFSAAEQMAIALERYRIMWVAQRQASIDDLTGLHNHRFFVDYLGQQVAIAERLKTPLSVLMLDIDHFKMLNDTHGHQAGDAALATFADTVRGCVRRSDLPARYGGEEFAVVMTNTNTRQARVVAEKIRRAVADIRVFVDEARPAISLTVSVGGASFPEDTTDPASLLSIADDALYHSKRAGRDRVTMAADERKPSKQARLSIVRTKPAREAVGAGGSDRSPE